MKIDCKDVTIVIPVRIDSQERKDNLNILLDYLIENFLIQIIILEADKLRQFYIKDNGDIFYYFIEDHDPVFYRTYYLNKLLNLAKTPIVGIWDTDVIVPIPQILKAINKIRQGICGMCFPYDGTFWGVNSELSCQFRLNKACSQLFDYLSSHTLLYGWFSYGGAFLVNKATYLKAGGENEKFYGWGGEDTERVKRLEILDIPIEWVEGPLFHLYHPRGINSSFSVRELELNNRREELNVCRMSKETLQAYIQTWE